MLPPIKTDLELDNRPRNLILHIVTKSLIEMVSF
jgi:hypothetical protein